MTHLNIRVLGLQVIAGTIGDKMCSPDKTIQQPTEGLASSTRGQKRYIDENGASDFLTVRQNRPRGQTLGNHQLDTKKYKAQAAGNDRGNEHFLQTISL